jgi:hypothetical protein
MPGLKKSAVAVLPAVMLLAAIIPSTAESADRKVLVEYFTRVN